MSVRAANPLDIPAVARVQVASWRGVYPGLIPDDVIDRLGLEHRIAQWTAYFDRGHDHEALLVSEHSGEVVGMASLASARDEDLEGEVGEIRAIYVTPDHWGHGHGRDLMASAEAWFRARGFGAAILWVLTANEQARRFYEAVGWARDGATKFEDLYGALVPEVRYGSAFPPTV